MARPKPELVITDMERQALESMAHRARTAPLLARLVLACGAGLDNTTVARKLRLSQPTVGRWRQRFIDRQADRWVARRTASGRAAHDYRRHKSRKSWSARSRVRPPGPRIGYPESVEGRRPQSDERASDLAGVWPATTPNDHVQALARSAAHRQGSGHRRLVFESTGARRRDLRSTRSHRSRRWTGARRCCRCALDKRSDEPLTTSGMAPRRSSPRWK